MGRRLRYNDDVLEQLTAALRKGATLKLACGFARISESTLGNWRRADANGDARFAGLEEALDTALAEGALHHLEVIDKAAASGDWRAAAWALENRYRYGKVAHVEITGQVEHGHEHRLDMSKMTMEQLRALSFLEDEDLDDDEPIDIGELRVVEGE